MKKDKSDQHHVHQLFLHQKEVCEKLEDKIREAKEFFLFYDKADVVILKTKLIKATEIKNALWNYYVKLTKE